jgi:nitroimidazol reductase NimA-like FMN-containing flavoprotein (pyridoxamine 5'-phosphate oxidase superfamily)
MTVTQKKRFVKEERSVMQSVRYVKRDCTDESKIEAFLTKTKTGFLGLSDDKGPYVVPLNFIRMGRSVYFHGAAEGRKIRCIQYNNQACLTVSEEFGTMTNIIPAHTDTAYMSVMIFGQMEFVTDLDEATEAMQNMLHKYVPGYYDQPLSKAHIDKYRSSLGSKTLVFKLNQTHLSAKENEPQEKAMFHPGRTVQQD